MYDTKVVVNQRQWSGPFPISYKEIANEDKIANEDTQEVIIGIMSAVPPEKLKSFQYLSEREIVNEDKAFILKIMKLDPRDRPVVRELLQDEWFTERLEKDCRMVFERGMAAEAADSIKIAEPSKTRSALITIIIIIIIIIIIRSSLHDHQ